MLPVGQAVGAPRASVDRPALPPAAPPTEAVFPHPQPAGVPLPAGFRASSGAADMRTQARLFRFQAATEVLCEWVGPFEGVPYLCKLFHDEVFPPGDRCRVIPVCPQPDVRFLALLESPFWVTEQLVVPVLFEILGEDHVFFCDFLMGRISFEDLRHSVGDLWIPGGNFYVGRSPDPVSEEEIVHLQPGSLSLDPALRLSAAMCALGGQAQRPACLLTTLVLSASLDSGVSGSTTSVALALPLSSVLCPEPLMEAALSLWMLVTWAPRSARYASRLYLLPLGLSFACLVAADPLACFLRSRGLLGMTQLLKPFCLFIAH